MQTKKIFPFNQYPEQVRNILDLFGGKVVGGGNASSKGETEQRKGSIQKI